MKKKKKGTLEPCIVLSRSLSISSKYCPSCPQQSITTPFCEHSSKHPFKSYCSSPCITQYKKKSKEFENRHIRIQKWTWCTDYPEEVIRSWYWQIGLCRNSNSQHAWKISNAYCKNFKVWSNTWDMYMWRFFSINIWPLDKT